MNFTKNLKKNCNAYNIFLCAGVIAVIYVIYRYSQYSFYFFLYGTYFQCTGYSWQPKKVRWLYSGNKTRSALSRLYWQCHLKANSSWCNLYHGSLFIAWVFNFVLECALLFWWHQSSHHRCRGDGFYRSSTISYDVKSVWRFDAQSELKVRVSYESKSIC